jgi:hypothetical protein
VPHVIELPDDLFAMLQRHAVPFIDTPLSVIERAVRALEEGDEEPKRSEADESRRTFNPAAPPNLTFTKPRSAIINERQLPYSQAYWNAIMIEVIKEAALRGVSTDELLCLITVNSQAGARHDNGFTFIKEAGLSIQGQDANGAWRQTYVIASSFRIPVDVVFAWQNNPKAAMPNTVGSLHIDGEQR